MLALGQCPAVPFLRHPGLDPGSRFLRRPLVSTSSGTPDQVRGDEDGRVRNRSLADGSYSSFVIPAKAGIQRAGVVAGFPLSRG